MARNIINLDGRFRTTGVRSSLSNNFQANPIPIPALIPGGTTNQVLAKSSNLSYDVQWVDESSGTPLTFENGITETSGTVTLGGDLTQENTILEGHASANRNIMFGDSNSITGFAVTASEDIDFTSNNLSVNTTGTASLTSNSVGQISVVPVASSTSGVRIRTANVQGSTAINGQLLSLVRSSTGEVEYINKKYSQSFADTDFSSQTLTITAATHGMGSNLNINVYTGASGSTRTAIYPATGTALVSITVATNGDVTLTSTSGNEFSGLIVIS